MLNETGLIIYSIAKITKACVIAFGQVLATLKSLTQNPHQAAGPAPVAPAIVSGTK